MYRRPKFLEILHQIREEMSREADYDVDLFAEMVRNDASKGASKEMSFDLQSLSLESFPQTEE
jgi:hypothetical protein